MTITSRRRERQGSGMCRYHPCRSRRRTLLSLSASSSSPLQWREMVTLETNVDDCSPQVLAYVQECLRDAGAIDTYAAPIVMKKGRLGTLLGVVCEADAADALTKIIFAETTSLGVRKTRIERAELRRKIVNVTTSTGDEVAVKVGYDDDGSIVNVHPEYEDAARVARRRGVPLKQVAEEAMDVARKQGILISSSSSSSAAAEACEQSEASGSEP